ncbi:MAG: ferrous iron transport protein B, partial [Gammaproteobacteria bacterium]|nr:ferrous iron transport protein B [Gammaproteobacteria bacterium]
MSANPAPGDPDTTPTVVALIGNPNTGKSTVFNGLTGLKQKTANYPGVTVERHTGSIEIDAQTVTLVDLPGTYSLTARSPDEVITIDVLLGKVESLTKPQAILAVADASNLRRNLFLITQLAELDIPIVLALNMVDLASKKGIEIDSEQLAAALGIRVVPVIASDKTGIEQLEQTLATAFTENPPARPVLLPAVHAAATELWHKLGESGRHLTPYEIERALIDARGIAERRFELVVNEQLFARLEDLRMTLSAGSSLAAMEAKARYDLIDSVLRDVETRREPEVTFAEHLDQFTNRPAISVMLFVLVMATVFQAVFSWATPLMELIDGIATNLSSLLIAILPEGALASLLVDGVIAGVGSVVIFLPQILILFAFIIFLEDSGYMPRVAFMADRIMRSVGLSGQSFIPMLSSYACAVPGIMATRVIPERRDRIATMLSAPMMTCSARLPVYALLISAFVPDRHFMAGFINLQGLVLLGLYLLGIVGGIITALLLKKTALSGPTPSFLIELPPYRLPNIRSMLIKLLARGKIFLTRAGSIIFTVAVLIWALAYFPRPQTIVEDFENRRLVAESTLQNPALNQQLNNLEQLEAATLLENSLLGRAGRFIEPVFAPLGWDWKISAAVIAGLPAREVVIAVLGTIYAVGDVESNENALITRLQAARHSDGSRVFTLPVVVGLLVFYAFALQCIATIAVMYRETNTWRWPLF